MFERYALLFPDVLASHGRWRANWPAIVSPEGTSSWEMFNRQTNRVANSLVIHGARKGDRIALLMSNGLAMMEIMVGIMKAGCIVVPLNPFSGDNTINAMLADADVAFVFATPEHAPRIKIAGEVGQVVATDSHTEAPAGWATYSGWLGDAGDTAPNVGIAPDDLCNIIYSSGTTGDPKGIVHTHHARLNWAYDIALALRYHSGARTLVTTGLYSNISWSIMLSTFLVGGTIVLQHTADSGEVLESIERERITHLAMVPVQFQRMLEHPAFETTDRSSMQAMMCCGSRLPTRIKALLFEAFPCGVIELYGLTEGLITTLAPEESAGRLDSVGRPLPGSDIRILGSNDLPVANGEAGEIVGRSRFTMAGYWRKPASTAESIWADEAGRNWLRTGDIGRLDENHYLYIVDRKKDMIISGGQNIYPADLEAVLLKHPQVNGCAVIGVPSDVWGESPLALVTLKEGATGDPDQIRQWLNERIDKRQRVVSVELRSELPRNATGKLLKRVLREPYWASQ